MGDAAANRVIGTNHLLKGNMIGTNHLLKGNMIGTGTNHLLKNSPLDSLASASDA